jgi:hypothetical protein
MDKEIGILKTKIERYESIIEDYEHLIEQLMNLMINMKDLVRQKQLLKKG